MFSPPREDGREVFNHDQSSNGPPARSERASRIMLSKHPKAFMIRAGGQVRSMYATLGKARQDRRRVVSICES